MKNFLKISTFTILLLFLFFIKDAEHISQIDRMIGNHKFNIFMWELKTLPKQSLDIFKSSKINEIEAINILENKDYDQKKDLEIFLEKEVTHLIKEKLGKDFLFPPLHVSIEKPPKVLIVSPRDKIFQKKAVLIKNDINLDEIEMIEKNIDALNLSSIILDTGGFAAYPSIVNMKNNYHNMVSTISHEWLHHYLFFYPLGRSYFKGGDMIFINETLADLFANQVSKNIKYEKSTSDNFFRIFMKETRENVDIFLQKKELNKAENYMDRRLIELQNNGYKIRKINQAYFAFYGNYGTSPSSIHSYHEDLSELMLTYDSFIEFLNEIKMIDDSNKFQSLLENRSINNE